MKFNHNVFHNGKMYLAGEDVPVDEPKKAVENPKPEKAEGSSAVAEEVKADASSDDAEPKKTVKKK